MTRTKISKLLTLTTTALAIGILGGISISNAADEPELVPTWIQNVAGFWSNGDVTDLEFVNAMEFLVDEGIMDLPNTVSAAEAQTITSSLEEMEQRIEQIETQQPTETTVGASTTPSQPPKEGEYYSPICPSDMIQHWDKVAFTLTEGMNTIRTDKDIDRPFINQGEVVDIKFRETPTEVETIVNLNQKVYHRLVDDLGFYVTGDNAYIGSEHIVIIDVEYAIVCAYPPGAGEYAVPAPSK